MNAARGSKMNPTQDLTMTMALLHFITAGLSWRTQTDAISCL